MTHLFNVFYERLHSGEEGPEFWTGSKPLQVAFFGIPLDSKNVAIWIFRAVREFISQTMGGRFKRVHGPLVSHFERFASRRINLVPRIFNNHSCSPSHFGNRAPRGKAAFVSSSENLARAISAELRYPDLQGSSSFTGAGWRVQ